MRATELTWGDNTKADYVSTTPINLHLPFESGSNSLSAETVLQGKLRVAASDNKLDPLGVDSVTMGDDSTDEDEGSAAAAALIKQKFVVGADDLATANRTGENPAAPKKLTEADRIKELEKKHAEAAQKRESLHEAEVSTLQTQIRSMVLEHEAKVKQLEESLRKQQQGTSVAAISVLRGQLEDMQAQMVAKNATLQTLREQLSEAMEKIANQEAEIGRLSYAKKGLEEDLRATRFGRTTVLSVDEAHEGGEGGDKKPSSSPRSGNHTSPRKDKEDRLFAPPFGRTGSTGKLLRTSDSTAAQQQQSSELDFGTVESGAFATWFRSLASFIIVAGIAFWVARKLL